MDDQGGWLGASPLVWIGFWGWVWARVRVRCWFWVCFLALAWNWDCNWNWNWNWAWGDRRLGLGGRQQQLGPMPR